MANTMATKIETKISDITSLANKIVLNAKDKEIETKIPDTTNFINTLEFNNLPKISFN